MKSGRTCDGWSRHQTLRAMRLDETSMDHLTPPQRRWLRLPVRLSVRAMMSVILVIAIAIAVFIIPAEREQRSSARLTELGARLNTADNRPDWVKSLLKDVPVTKITSVDLAGTGVADAELGYLQDFPKLGGLILDRTKISNGGMIHIVRATSLVQLSLSRTNVTDFRLDGLTELQDLDLSGNRFIKLSLGRMNNLRTLNLRSSNIADLGLSSLEGLIALDYLDLRDTEISDKDLQTLKGLSSLKTLCLYNTRVTDRGVSTLLLANPKLAVKR
jgi:Leucine-rich repeat (LRR) protein